MTCAGAALATAYVFLAPKTYTATVLVQVNALPNNANAVGGRTGGPVNMDNEAQSVRSLAVASLVKKRLGSSLSADDISNDIHVSVPPNSTYLQITCAASSAVAAQKCANAAGAAYLDYRRVSIMHLLGTGSPRSSMRRPSWQQGIVKFKTLLLTLRHHQQESARRIADPGRRRTSVAGAQTSLLSIETHISQAEPLRAAWLPRAPSSGR